MDKLVMICEGEGGSAQKVSLSIELEMRGFRVWDDHTLRRGGKAWKEAFKAELEHCAVMIMMMFPFTKASPLAERQIAVAREHNIPIIPILDRGDPTTSIPAELINTPWIDFTEGKYRTGFEELVEKLYMIYGVDSEARHAAILHELRQVTLHIPDIGWRLIIGVGGYVHPLYRFDTDFKPRNPEIQEEDRAGAMSGFVASVSERIAHEFVLGSGHFAVISGPAGTHFLVPIGEGTPWFLSMLVKGQLRVDETIQYFRDRNFLAHIVPFLQVQW